MTRHVAARRYARALFDVAVKERVDLEELQRSLSAFARLLTTNDGLIHVISNPAIAPVKKRAVMEQLVARAGGVQPILAKLLLLLAERDRLILVPDIASGYEQRLMEHRQIVRAEVTTPIALPPDRVAALQDGLARATGRKVQLETRIDPSILGGAVARIGSTVYDGSVTRQLEKMKEALISE